jgi:hypothetical protein
LVVKTRATISEHSKELREPASFFYLTVIQIQRHYSPTAQSTYAYDHAKRTAVFLERQKLEGNSLAMGPPCHASHKWSQ